MKNRVTIQKASKNTDALEVIHQVRAPEKEPIIVKSHKEYIHVVEQGLADLPIICDCHQLLGKDVNMRLMIGLIEDIDPILKIHAIDIHANDE